MPSAEEIKYLLQATLSSVKRFGGKRPSLSHLAQILSTKWDDEFIQIFGDNGSQRVALLLQAGSYVGDESDVAVVLKAGADRQAVLNELRSRLQDAMDKACDAQRSEPEAPSQPTEAPEEVVRTEPLAANGSEWPARTQRFVRGIIRRDDVLEREDAVDQIIGALARSRRLIPIVMGSRGSGRTSVTGRLAARLADRNGGTVWGVEPSALGPEPESPLARVIEDCESGSILVDDEY